MIIALGFATTVAMWAIGYAGMTGPGLVVGEILFGVELLALLAGGVIAGRVLRTIRAGFWVGAVSATVNLLIVGSLLGSGGGSAAIWIVGLYVASVALGSIGAAVGARGAGTPTLPLATSLFSLIAAATVFLLLITGGLVTGLEAGLAVPDWPNSFGHNMLLYPMSEMTGGIYYEHAHRLYGMLVGITSIALFGVLLAHERRTWVKWLMGVLFVMVCVQGLMGGLRVTGSLTLDTLNTTPSLVLAIVHGVFGQVVFAGFCWMAVATSRAWSEPGARQSIGAAPNLFVAALLVQLVLGALYRHLQTPEYHPMWAIGAHLCFAFIVVVLALIVGIRASRPRAHPLPTALGWVILALVAVQFILGVLALVAVILRPEGEGIPLFEVLSTTAHQANGALMLGTATALAALLSRPHPR